MKKLLLLLLVILTIGCSKDEETTPQTVAPPVIVETPIPLHPNFANDPIYGKIEVRLLNTYWVAFKASAALYGHDLDYLDPITIETTTLSGGTAGIAIGSCKDEVHILIDESKFLHLEDRERLFLMYHEFGHDAFNASHTQGLMRPSIGVEDYREFQKFVKNFFEGKDYRQWSAADCAAILG